MAFVLRFGPQRWVLSTTEQAPLNTPSIDSLRQGEIMKINLNRLVNEASKRILERSIYLYRALSDERGDVPGWVLVVLMTTGLVTGIWTLAAPRIDSILRNSLDSMNGIR